MEAESDCVGGDRVTRSRTGGKATFAAQYQDTAQSRLLWSHLVARNTEDRSLGAVAGYGKRRRAMVCFIGE